MKTPPLVSTICACSLGSLLVFNASPVRAQESDARRHEKALEVLRQKISELNAHSGQREVSSTPAADEAGEAKAREALHQKMADLGSPGARPGDGSPMSAEAEEKARVDLRKKIQDAPKADETVIYIPTEERVIYVPARHLRIKK